MSNKGPENQIPRELGSYFLEDDFLRRQGGCDTIFIIPMNPVQIHSYFKKNKGVHAKNLGPGQLG